MFVVAGCSGPLPNAVPLPLARSSPPVSQSSTPSSRDSIWNGKPAPSTYLHKLLDVTRAVRLLDFPKAVIHIINTHDGTVRARPRIPRVRRDNHEGQFLLSAVRGLLFHLRACGNRACGCAALLGPMKSSGVPKG